MTTEALKTYEGWRSSNTSNLSQYLQPGDAVDESMVDWAISVMPPRTMRGDLVQIGEAANHVNGRATYTTFARKSLGSPWQYVGECYARQSAPPPPLSPGWGTIVDALQLAVSNAESRLYMLPLSADKVTADSLRNEGAKYRIALSVALDMATSRPTA